MQICKDFSTMISLTNMRHHISRITLAAVIAAGAMAAYAAPDPDPVPDPRLETDDADFSINSSTLPVTPGLRRIVAIIDTMKADGTLRSIKIVGSASPDGPTALNKKLALRRARAVAAYIESQVPILPGFIQVESDGENVAGFIGMMRESSNPDASRILEIFNSPGTEAEHEATLRSLDGGRVWRWLAADVFPSLRTAMITVDGADKVVTVEVKPEASKTAEPVLVQPKTVEPDMLAEEAEDIVVTELADTVADEDVWTRHLYLKTNMPAWLMLWTNIAVEIDLAKHWSFTLPIYYSGFNYFKHTVKFRTLTFQPEFRYWFKPDNTGPFLGAHFGLGWYNAAFDGEYRYQDHYKHTPAIGGGIAFGWRFYFCRNHHWQMEATVGAGIYKLDYDLFENRYNGPLTGRRQRTFYGIDQAALTISYRFDLDKRPNVKAQEGGEK